MAHSTTKEACIDRIKTVLSEVKLPQAKLDELTQDPVFVRTFHEVMERKGDAERLAAMIRFAFFLVRDEAKAAILAHFEARWDILKRNEPSDEAPHT